MKKRGDEEVKARRSDGSRSKNAKNEGIKGKKAPKDAKKPRQNLFFNKKLRKR